MKGNFAAPVQNGECVQARKAGRARKRENGAQTRMNEAVTLGVDEVGPHAEMKGTKGDDEVNLQVDTEGKDPAASEGTKEKGVVTVMGARGNGWRSHGETPANGGNGNGRKQGNVPLLRRRLYAQDGGRKWGNVLCEDETDGRSGTNTIASCARTSALEGAGNANRRVPNQGRGCTQTTWMAAPRFDALPGTLGIEVSVPLLQRQTNGDESKAAANSCCTGANP
ncbi:hypothetical protein EDB92DRAFT_1816309 [Lactarius akahatsu]|uniref:Uncharacterized protein n=1 Tax=Lactarius akahatsu TaxID=416441 RepID=A0AAD4LGJ5_9AGAM|nr:hypothetical protein EDB92DRAFT_1816309 [Lactarius akahatsu]